MFDPTIYENLKVAFENQVYDLDNLSGKVRITGRVDRLVVSNMSRDFSLRFQLADVNLVTAEIELQASLEDLAVEILEIPDETPGCSFTIRFYLQITDVTPQCERVEEVLQSIWAQSQKPSQTLSFVYGEEPPVYIDVIELNFQRKINEDQMGDIPDLIEHVLQSLAELGKL